MCTHLKTNTPRNTPDYKHFNIFALTYTTKTYVHSWVFTKDESLTLRQSFVTDTFLNSEIHLL